MKTNKRNLGNQRQIIDKKLRLWDAVRTEQTPPSGWIKAVRGALGINTRQLADLLDVEHSNISRLEKRESEGNATLEVINKVARAMDCKLVYAIVPNPPYTTLENILDTKANDLAHKLNQDVEHSMQLEKQGTSPEDYQKQVERLAQELKANLDSRLWEKRISKNKGRGKV
jgi:predicted DNA-binding mobile mystery protein A